jgi:hypothetical protein
MGLNLLAILGAIKPADTAPIAIIKKRGTSVCPKK